MKVWIFLFADGDLSWESARIAAPDQASASLLLAGETGLDVGALAQGQGRRVLCHYAGEADLAQPAILCAVPRREATR